MLIIDRIGQMIKVGYVYGEVYKILGDDRYIIKFGLHSSSPEWYKEMHISELKSV